MAEFTGSPMVSPFPSQNILFNSASGLTGQELQKNQLAIQGQQMDLTAADHEQVARLSAALLNEPDLTKRGDLYARGVGMLQSQNLAKYAPATLPDESTLRMLAAQGVPAKDLYTLSVNQTAKQNLVPTDGTASSAPPAPGTGAAPSLAIPARGTGGPGASASAPTAWLPYFEEASKETGIPVDLLIAQARQESGFNPNATGQAGEVGVFQIKPSTAQSPGFGVAGVDPGSITGPDNVRNNILFGARYLKARMGGGDPTNPAVQAAGLHGYNGGGDPNYVANVFRYRPTLSPTDPNAAVTAYTPPTGGTTTAAAPAPAGGGGTPGRVQVASVTPTTATDGTTAPPGSTAAPPRSGGPGMPAAAGLKYNMTSQGAPAGTILGYLPNGNAVLAGPAETHVGITAWNADGTPVRGGAATDGTTAAPDAPWDMPGAPAPDQPPAPPTTAAAPPAATVAPAQAPPAPAQASDLPPIPQPPAPPRVGQSGFTDAQLKAQRDAVKDPTVSADELRKMQSTQLTANAAANEKSYQDTVTYAREMRERAALLDARANKTVEQAQAAQRAQREADAAGRDAERLRLSQESGGRDTERLRLAQADAAVKARQAAQPYQGMDLGAQDTNVLMSADPNSKEYAIAYQRMAAPHYNQDGSVVYPNLSAFQKPGYVPPGASEPPDYGAAKVTPPTILTQDQARAGTYADRMVESNAIMSTLDSAALDYVQKGLSKIGGTVGFGMNSSDYQRVRQAQENFVNSALRLESGAVISEDEFKKASQQYFPQPGDSAAVIAQKKANREAEITGFVREAGPGYKPKTIAPVSTKRPPLSSFQK